MTTNGDQVSFEVMEKCSKIVVSVVQLCKCMENHGMVCFNG